MIRAFIDFINQLWFGKPPGSRIGREYIVEGEIEIVRINRQMVSILFDKNRPTYRVPPDEANARVLYDPKTKQYYLLRAILAEENSCGEMLVTVRVLATGEIAQLLLPSSIVRKTK